MQNRTTVFWALVLALGWLFDYLFWDKAPGVSFTLYVALLLVAGLAVLRMEGKRLHRRSVLLLLPIGFFAIFSFLRLEPMSRLLAFALTLALMALLAVSATGGRWAAYDVLDYIVKPLELAGSALARGGKFLGEARRQRQAAATEGNAPAQRRLAPAARGVLLALPVLGVFLALLASADLIFAQRLRDFTDLFDLEYLDEYITRIGLILIAAYVLAGVYLHAVQKSGDEKLAGADRPAITPPLGFTEAAIVLGSVVLLFAIFVTFQFQYFFSGAANIRLEGFTYAEYARRGFGELVTVAVASLLLFLGLSAVARRESEIERRVYSGLGIGLTALVGLILLSAFQRLLLYETVYGFSRLRTYPHVFMIWLGLLLAATAALEITRRQRLFMTAALLAAIGFAATLNIMNVDSFIARQNVLRATTGAEMDVAYLVSLSADTVPELVRLYRSEGLPEASRDAAGAVLACKVEAQREAAAARTTNQPEAGPAWQSFHLSEWQGERWLAAVGGDLLDYQIKNVRNNTLSSRRVVTPLGVSYWCNQTYDYMD